MRELLSGPGEFAFLDVREQGVHARGHPFHACSAPLSHLETMVADLVPRRTVPVVLFDNGDEGLADRAAGRLADVRYADLSVLEGGCTGWEASGGELFSGVNVPSKAFGEYIEHRFQTPAIGPEELKAMLDRGEPVVVLDSRPYDEYHRMTIPRSIDVPGAELVYRVHDLLPDTDPLVVVNCAGRTRSIIGCQSLRNAGIPYRVAALTNGTMGWEMAGLGCERGATRVAVPPSERGYAMAVAGADRIAKRFGVEFVGGEIVRAWQHDTARTLFLLDVRTREEFEAGRIAGSRHAPGGQLVQATDEYIGVRNARIVLIDPAGVRSVLTASWLNQMGLKDVYVLKPEGDDGFAGWAPERGQRRPARSGFSRWPTLQAGELERMLGRDETAVIDLSSSLSFRNGHVPGAWWGVRSRLKRPTRPCRRRSAWCLPLPMECSHTTRRQKQRNSGNLRPFGCWRAATPVGLMRACRSRPVPTEAPRSWMTFGTGPTSVRRTTRGTPGTTWPGKWHCSSKSSVIPRWHFATTASASSRALRDQAVGPGQGA